VTTPGPYRGDQSTLPHRILGHAPLFAVVAEVAAVDPSLREHRQELHQGFVERAARGIRALQARGFADSGLDAELSAALLCGMVERFAEVRHLLSWQVDDDEAVATMTQIWARALQLES